MEREPEKRYQTAHEFAWRQALTVALVPTTSKNPSNYRQPGCAKAHLEKWMRSAMGSRLEPFKRFVRTLRSHLDGILSWTKQRVSNGAVEGMNNKIKSISHRSFGFRSAKNFIAAIYHCCARLPLPVER